MREVLRPTFAADEVHHVGDVVAAVVAETRYQTLDALDVIAVEYEPLPWSAARRAPWMRAARSCMRSWAAI